jgi:hypothetical protein
MENGNRYRIPLAKDNSLNLDLGPAESFLFVFDKQRSGTDWKPLPVEGQSSKTILSGWKAEFRHCHDGSVKMANLDTLKDLKEMADFADFSGTVIYSNSFNIQDPEDLIINLGKAWGLSELSINGKSCGVKWYGRRLFDVSQFAIAGLNKIEIRVVTTMGNYMKSLTDNPIAQYWTNEKNKIQPLQSMGLIGPVSIYKKTNT